MKNNKYRIRSIVMLAGVNLLSCNEGKNFIPMKNNRDKGKLTEGEARLKIGKMMNRWDRNEIRVFFEELKESGIDINIHDLYYNTFLTYAVMHNDLPMIRLLVEHNANIFFENICVSSPMLAALEFFNQKAFLFFLKKKPRQVCTEFNVLSKLLFDAYADYDTLKIKKFLVKNSFNLNMQDGLGNTLLHYAVKNKDYAVIFALITLGADPYIENQKHMSPFFMAINDEDEEMFLFFLNLRKQGTLEVFEETEFILEKKAIDLNRKNSSGKTPLQWAVESGNPKIAMKILDQENCPDINMFQPYNVEILSEQERSKQQGRLFNTLQKKGINPHAISCQKICLGIVDEERRTLLHFALIQQQYDLAKKLISLSPAINLNAKDNNGNTPLHIAILRKAPIDLIKMLISKGAKWNIINNDQQTSVDIAKMTECTEFVQLIGVFRNDKDKDGNNTLHLAVKEGDIQKTKELLDQGMNPNDTNLRGETPLHFAVTLEENSDNIIELLLNHGAVFIHDSSKENKTPLSILYKKGDINTIKRIMEVIRNVLPQQFNQILEREIYKQGLLFFAMQNRNVVEVIPYLNSICKILNKNLKNSSGFRPIYYSLRADIPLEDIQTLLNLKFYPDKAELQKCVDIGRIDIARFFIEQNITQKFKFFDFGIDLVMKNDDLEMLQKMLKPCNIKTNILSLIKHGINQSAYKILKFLLEQDFVQIPQIKKDINTGELKPIVMAINRRDHEMVKWLIDNQLTDLSWIDDRTGENLVHLATKVGDHQSVSLLLSKGINIDAVTTDSFSALDLAIFYNQLNIFDIIMRFNPSLIGTHGNNILHQVVEKENAQFIQHIFEKYHHLAMKLSQGVNKMMLTPCHLAAYQGYCEIIQLFIKYGIDVNIPSPIYLCTPLMWALKYGRVNTAKVLLSKSSKESLQNRDAEGRTALKIAEGNGLMSIVNDIRERELSFE